MFQRQLVCFVGGLLASFALGGGAPASAKTLAKTLVKVGKVRVARGVGGRVVQLSDDKGKRWLLLGKAKRELLRLNNHRVTVWATLGKRKAMMPTLVVRRYALGLISGRKPLLGRVIERANHAVGLQQKDRVLPIHGKKPFIKRLERRIGCKIWIVGDIAGGKLEAFKFGWLDCTKRRPIKRRPPKRKES